jgi:predicted nucleotidyltransferase component of viral defense system
MSWIGEAKELARALKIEAELLLHEELQKQTLRAIYLNPRLREVTLHGGTALRMVYGSPRFSLDLDFTGKPSLDLPDLPRELISSIKPFEKLMGFNIGSTAKKILSNKHDFLRFNLIFIVAGMSKRFRIKVELLEKDFTRGVRREFSIKYPTPTVVYVKIKELSDILVDKVCAIAGRSYALPRNIYDVDFIVRKGGKLNPKHMEEEFGEWRETREGLRKAITLLERADRKSILKEINLLLPESARIGLDDVNRSVGTTLEVLKEAMSILHG